MSETFSNYENCGGCGKLTEKSDLKKGLCIVCSGNAVSKARSKVERADERALANVARTLLQSISSAGKDEPVCPGIIEAALDELGGIEKFGRMIAKQIKVATGEDISALPPNAVARWKYAPQVAFKWSELLARLAVKHDERTTIDVASLSQEDLLSNLQPLAMDIIQNSPEYRALMYKMIVQIDPSLASGNAIDADEVESIPDPLIAELDYSEAGDEDA